MTGLICNLFHWGSSQRLFVVLPFHRWELVRYFGGKGEMRSLKVFSKLSAINGFDMPLPTTV